MTIKLPTATTAPRTAQASAPATATSAAKSAATTGTSTPPHSGDTFEAASSLTWQDHLKMKIQGIIRKVIVDSAKV